MKRYIPFLFLLAIGAMSLGCGGTTPDPSTEENATEINESPDYEKEMMGGGDK